MKRQIRRGVFESNSSSTHSLCICTKDEFERWKMEELLFDSWEDKFIEVACLDQLTEEDKEHTQATYNAKKQKYWKAWEELSEEEREELYHDVLEQKKSRVGYEYETYAEYMYDGYLESYTKTYTSPSGDELVIFGKYGYDG